MRYFSLFVFCIMTACAPVSQTSTLNKPSGAQGYASVGDVLFRVDAKESLPNAFGGADVFGRTRDRGFSELRYMGLNTAKQPVFRRRDVDIMTNETTMNRSGLRATFVDAQPNGAGVSATAISTSAPRAHVETLPPDTVEFALDLSKSRTITMRDRSVEIVEAGATGVSFIPH